MSQHHTSSPKKNEKGECGKVLSKFGNREFLPVGFSSMGFLSAVFLSAVFLSAVFLSAGGFVTLSLSQI